jgi:hypothetical protein
MERFVRLQGHQNTNIPRRSPRVGLTLSTVAAAILLWMYGVTWQCRSTFCMRRTFRYSDSPQKYRDISCFTIPCSHCIVFPSVIIIQLTALSSYSITNLGHDGRFLSQLSHRLLSGRPGRRLPFG